MNRTSGLPQRLSSLEACSLVDFARTFFTKGECPLTPETDGEGVPHTLPHGGDSLFDSLIQWLAWHEIDRPIIPIDLRQDDWVVSYNLLRQRTADPAVLVDNLTDAMAYVWGQGGTNQTPLFARWAGNVLRALYEKRLTLVEDEYLVDRIEKQIRYALTGDLTDKPSRQDWQFADTLSAKDFEAQIGSTVNPFLTSSPCYADPPEQPFRIGFRMLNRESVLSYTESIAIGEIPVTEISTNFCVSDYFGCPNEHEQFTAIACFDLLFRDMRPFEPKLGVHSILRSIWVKKEKFVPLTRS